MCYSHDKSLYRNGSLVHDNSFEIQTHLEIRTKYVMNSQINQMIQNPSSRLDKYDQNRKHEDE